MIVHAAHSDVKCNLGTSLCSAIDSLVMGLVGRTFELSVRTLFLD